MADILPFRTPPPETKAVTCGCGGQTFILVTGKDEEPDFIYCVQCQHKLSKVNWFWVEEGA